MLLSFMAKAVWYKWLHYVFKLKFSAQSEHQRRYFLELEAVHRIVSSQQAYNTVISEVFEKIYI